MTRRFHGLKKIVSALLCRWLLKNLGLTQYLQKVRQSWNKYNLYNLHRLRVLRTEYLTFYQQKWAAKAATRAYHGEQIKEGQWERMFSSRLKSVVPMNHKYLATQDGSEQAEGRGSGKDLGPRERSAQKAIPPTPYMHMTYAPSERRLDTAVFRALFASSARQARQFVVHGWVKVNGKKVGLRSPYLHCEITDSTPQMIHPGYLLNPGDMFQVDPERVMFATGEPKNNDISQVRKGRKLRKSRKNENKKLAEEPSETSPAIASKPEEPIASPVMPELSGEEKEAAEAERRASLKVIFKDLMAESKSLQATTKDAPSANRKKELRAFQDHVRLAINKANRKSISELEGDLEELMEQLTIVTREKGVSVEDAVDEKRRQDSGRSEKSLDRTQADQITEEERVALTEMLRETKENPINNTKSYATPWRPRPFMSAFAFIPRYLEVNQNICSAVYLRHPVARPGLAEVPTPFPYEVSQLAFTWYLRRR